MHNYMVSVENNRPRTVRANTHEHAAVIVACAWELSGEVKHEATTLNTHRFTCGGKVIRATLLNQD